ncbi:MAG: DUF5119 domain-containing protein [Bacteroides sp.]|nr:DUF5119 domain-containing protein [Bacteroides sp.]MCM1379447.1 DUF5119 domain-containing protein [Bacteroides sp.]MCM1445308.1 DUF5119 domain-containing protein [Prevotella sp.]
MRSRILLYIFALMALLLTSCRHKELCEHHDHRVRVRLEFDWLYAPEVDRPPLMSVWFYPADPMQTPFYGMFDGATGGYIEVPAGRYTLVSHPAESEVNRTTSAKYSGEHSLHTRPASSSELLFNAGTAPTNLILEPETTWVASAADVDVQETGVTYTCVIFREDMGHSYRPRESKEQVITLYPSDPMCYYDLEVRNLKYDVKPTGIAGALQALARGIYPSTLEKHSVNASEAFECRIGADGIIRADFITFGYHRDSTSPHLLHLFFKSTDGKLFTLNVKSSPKLDLTDQVRGAPDPRHVHLIVDFEGKEIEFSPEVSGEFSASGEEYKEENFDINI